MSFNERVDVIDLILKVLKEHEKNLDVIVSQLRDTISTQPVLNQVIADQFLNKYRVNLHKWFEFRERCIKSNLIAFDMFDEQFIVSAVKNGSYYLYSETVPEVTIKMEKDKNDVLIDGGEFRIHEDPTKVFNGKLQCGLCVRTKKTKIDLPNGDSVHRIIYDIDPDEARHWLSEELRTDKKSIVFGRIEL